jgi:hypothetical protein
LDDDGGTEVIPEDTTFDTSVRMSLNFPTGTETYMFYVRTQDNQGTPDPTASSVEINMATVRSLDRFVPTTTGITVPPNGASTSLGVPFAIGGADVDGIVSTFEWAVDDISHDTMWTTMWTSATPDVITVSSSSAIITLTPTELTLGPHTVYFRAIDNAGNPDPSPLSVSIVCEAGYQPEVSISILEGFNFVVPYTAPVIDTVVIEITVLMDFYYGGLENIEIITSEGDTINTTEYSFIMTDLTPDDYWVKITADDVGGNTTIDSTNFGVVELLPGDGVLCINGADWPTYPEAVARWEGGAYWGNRTHFKIWDLMGDSPAGGDFADSLLGSGDPPLWLIDTLFFDAIVWAYNNYSDDNVYWEDEDMQAAINAYLESGGNLWIGGRHGHYIWADGSQEFIDYCEYTGYTDGLDPDSLVAVHDSLTNIGRTSGLSFFNVVTTSHATAEQLYETSDGEVGAGWVITPNGAGGGGAVAYIGGRHYRMVVADLKDNMDVILRYWFGIEN